MDVSILSAGHRSPGAPGLDSATWDPNIASLIPVPAILLLMPQDPMEEWRRLTALYGEMGDLEIRELADQINDLTPTAQQVLRDEIKKRGITNEPPSAPAQRPVQPVHEGQVNWEPSSCRRQFGSSPDENDAPHEYSWKVALCDCDSRQEAWRIAQMLKRAGIDSWIQGQESAGSSRILVGADQLDQAQLVAAQPVPQDILDEEKELQEAREYDPPTCPRCKSPDPTLESVEPTNNWLCESCGYTWSDPVPNEA